jgi:aspartyl-tRNA(Asn)/glutamyl-tRNA(Gln) amidotransferase subunit C
MPIDIDVEHVARLARLALTDEERERFLEHAATVAEVAAEHVPPTYRPVASSNVFREDEVLPGLSPEEALANAPQVEEGRFRVPPILEAEE